MTAPWRDLMRLAVGVGARGRRLSGAAMPLVRTAACRAGRLTLAAMLTMGAVAGAAGNPNPYEEHFVPHAPRNGTALLPAPPSPELFRGGDFQTDELAMLENSFVLLGASMVADGGADARLAVAAGKRLGAAAVIVYGRRFDVFPGRPLPWRPNLPEPPPGAHPTGAGFGLSMIPAPSPAALAAGYAASYWGRVEPTIFGAVLRPLDGDEMARLSRRTGAVVEAVVTCTSAQAANILRGDVLVAIDGKPITDVAAIDPFLDSIAGQQIHVDLLRNGRPLAIAVQLSQHP